MAQRILRRKEGRATRPRRRVAAGNGNYFAGEVIRILGLRHLDYDQLHRLFAIIRGDVRARSERETWRRFTYTDLANLKVAAKLIGAGPKKVQRLRMKQLASVCAHLREEFGLEHPLLHAQLRAIGSTIVVRLDGVHYDATTTQRVFDQLAADVSAYEKAAGVTPTRTAAGVVKADVETSTCEVPAMKVVGAR